MRATEFTNFNYKTEPYEGWNGDGMIVRAYDGKDEVGYVIFEPTEDDVSQWYAVDVEVEEPYQRKGIATKMYDIAKKAAKQQNAIIVKSHAQTNDGRGLWQDKKVWEQGVAEGVPQPGPSSGTPKQFGADAKIQTRQMTVKDIISSVPGVPYYNNVVDDWDAKDYSWGVTKKVIEYATYLKDHPESLAKLPPAIVLNGKFEDGAHRVSAIWLLQQRMDPKNPLWKNTKLNVQFVKQGVAEGEGKSKDPIENAILDFYQHVGKIHKDPIDDYVSTAKEMLGHVSDPTLKSKLLDIFKQAKQNPYIQGGVVTTIGALLAGGVLSSAQKMGLSPSQTNLALQAILNTVIPTVVSRINGKNWSDTIKYTLASMGIGTGIAGIMEESRGLAPTKPYDDLMANMGYFMSLNTVKIQQDAVDSNAQQELANMQQQFRKPILNGMSFFDVNRDIKISKNPKVAPILLKYVYDMLGYIEPRIKKYIKPEQQGKYLDRLNQIKNDYRGAVQQVS